MVSDTGGFILSQLSGPQGNYLMSITTYNYFVANVDLSSCYLQDLAFSVTLPLFLWGFLIFGNTYGLKCCHSPPPD
jgi:hypothetical protein